MKLEALPVSGELQIRDYVPREEGVGGGRRRSNGDSVGDFAEIG